MRCLWDTVKDFGSMKMNKLLKNIWNAEETQTNIGLTSLGQDGGALRGHLQRQPLVGTILAHTI
ncbi:ARM REPEAT PROTEIN INTERACTING WITH abf2 [Sarracenia purpurea var. burkii]